MQLQRCVVFLYVLRTHTNKNRLTSTDVGVEWWGEGTLPAAFVCVPLDCYQGIVQNVLGKQRKCNFACITKLC